MRNVHRSRFTQFISLGIGSWMMLAALSGPAATEEGFRSLFNGQDLSGWGGDPRYWSVEDGAITGRITAENPLSQNIFLIWQQGTVDDFELRLSFRIVDGNSGIQYRSRIRESGEAEGYQADIEDGPGWIGALYDENGRGALAERGQKTVIDADGGKKTETVADRDDLYSKIHKQDWNEYTVIARGNHLTHKINGLVTAEVIDQQTAEAERSGVLALQTHSGPPMTVQFKNIRLKRLPLQDKKKIVLVAGKPSHGPRHHEHNAGVQLLKQCLDGHSETLSAVYLNGWPSDPTAFDNADSVLLYMDGGAGHPLIQEESRLKQIDALLQQGKGLCALHYTLEVPKDKGGSEMLNWLGGYYEKEFSINPNWDAVFEKLPEHAITRGIKPFTIMDEWYFNIRFEEKKQGFTALLTATPPDDVRRTEAAQQHPGRPEIVSWCVEHPNGARAFAFTGAHYHDNWGQDDFRKLVLNAVYWTARAEVPAEGVASAVTEEDLDKNLDEKRPREE